MSKLNNEAEKKRSGRREFLVGTGAIAGGLVLSLANTRTASAETETPAADVQAAEPFEKRTFDSNVYVFNFSNAEITTLMINNSQVTGGSLGGWGDSYQPKSIAVSYSNRGSGDYAATFSQSLNDVFVEWGRSIRKRSFSIDMSRHDPTQDYLLYINPSQATLFDSYGKSIGTF